MRGGEKKEKTKTGRKAPSKPSCLRRDINQNKFVIARSFATVAVLVFHSLSP
jgi:hypothetical protein